jgi:hypothetical protein
MVIRKIVVCTACALTVFAAAGCADGTGKALTPILPTPTDSATSNADGTLLKATAPQPSTPRSLTRVSNLTPTLLLTNGSAQFDSSASLSYVFQVYDGSDLAVESDPVSGSGSETAWTVPANVLKLDKTYSWRGRAVFNGVAGTWSDSAGFRTPLPPPTESSSGGPGPVPCAGSSGPSIIACVGAAYPSKLAAKVSVNTRKANMEFIRDRIIETGLCKGQDFGRNFKRGTPVISHDYLVWRQPGQRDRGVDIASGYDDPSTRLKLTWQVKGPPDYGFPYYAKYPPVDCSGVQ